MSKPSVVLWRMCLCIIQGYISVVPQHHNIILYNWINNIYSYYCLQILTWKGAFGWSLRALTGQSVMKTSFIHKWREMNWHVLSSCPVPLQRGQLPRCLYHPVSLLLISCSIIRTSLHSCIILCAHTSTRLILQVYPQPSGAVFRQNCLDLDKWGR